MQEVSKFDVEISVIPNGLENYMAFTINKNLIFIDNMQFMNPSLDVSVKNLPDNDFKHLLQEFNGDSLKLVKQKGVYPYENTESYEKFFAKQLSERCKFYSSLKDECISGKDYLHANNVWNMFKMKAMGGYHHLYLKTDVLLADVFENFVSTCLKYYGLDPCHCFTSSGLSWDAMLKMDETELELIRDIDLYLLIKKGMREGISDIAKSK